MYKRFILLFLIISIATYSYATHQRAGEITYKAISSLTYEITMVTYTYTPSPADRPELDISWGDGTTNVIYRVEKTNLSGDISKNVYKAQHTYPGPDSYIISMEDPNRNSGIVNIPNSVNVPFYIETVLIINPFLGANNSPVLLNPPIDNGCTNVPYYHNPGAYDSDGDSLVYSLVRCRGYNGDVIPGYSYPYAKSTLSINSSTGDLYWDYPVSQGEYNIAILIEEYRYGIKIGSVIRDMQITINACKNTPPELTIPNDTCITAGTLLEFDIQATDDAFQEITLTATGGPLQQTSSPATFTQNVQGYGSVKGHFAWQTNCSHIRKQSYLVTFKAKDNGSPIALTIMKSWRINIVAPAPENVQAQPIANAVEITWNQTICSNASYYAIYRRNNAYDFMPDNCETGIPEYTGYQFIGKTDHISDTSYTDSNNLLHGREYCYRIIAVYPDLSESYASDEVCVYLKKDVPFITNISVEKTDTLKGIIDVKWTQPTEFDTLFYPGPYQYEIYRKSSAQSQFELVQTFNHIQDTVFCDSLKNTAQLTYWYRIALINNTVNHRETIGYSDNNSSVFLKVQSANRQLQLSWDETVSWINSEYTVYKWNDDVAGFDSIATTTQQSYTDKNLINGKYYRYYIRSKGAYFVPDTILNLYNKSQIIKAMPFDNQPPETPSLTATTDCHSVVMNWTFTSSEAADDVYYYYIHVKANNYSDFVVIDSFPNNNIFNYTITDGASVIGCYTITAMDSNRNITPYAQIYCFDADVCPNYKLPNVFTPNGDGYNDVFGPFPYSNIERVNMFIYNRWGRLVFKTENPDIQWDGKQTGSDKVVNGVYYYICEVSEYTLNGITQNVLKGSITLIK